MSKKKVQHHYLSASYQKRFSDQFTESGNKTRIWVLDERQIYPTTPDKKFREKHYHTVFGSLFAEDGFAEIEGDFKKVADKIEKREELSDEEKAMFAYFIALMACRPRPQKESLREFLEDIIEDAKNTDLDDLPESIPSEGRDSVSIEDLEEEMEDYDSLYTLSVINNADESCAFLMSMEWNFLFSPEERVFVCSDAPFSMCSPVREQKYGPRAIGARAGLRHKDVEVTFPISMNCALLARYSEDHSVSQKEADPQSVQELNWRTIRGSGQVFTHKKETLENIKKSFDHSRPAKSIL